ncbi:FliM/FliN family flagellar motor switch protein [Primorskyibacter flagellatus]|uniref:FliM/FliN family flagellar motor switch protein n=1 Tax=Primorskyibacter flagellatus TaxID=1387277 RepID=UPI003A9052AD
MVDSTTTQTPTPGDQQSMLTRIPIEISISVGKARPLVRDLLGLEEQSVLVLDKLVSDPVELYVGDKLIGVGSLEMVEGDETGRLAVRIIEIADLQSSLT